MSSGSLRLSACLRTLCLSALLSFLPALSKAQPAFASGVPTGIVAPANLTELSGLVSSRRSPGVLWTHNDGSRDKVYALSTNGQLLATYDVNDPIDDFEELAVGPGPLPELTYLYIGDIGDNNFSRSSFRIYRTPEPAVYPYMAAAPVARNFEIVEQFTIAYPDGSYDTEAFLCDPRTGDLYFFTKQSSSRVYRVAASELRTNTVIVATFVTTLFFSQPSAATISPDGSEIILRQEDFAYLWQRGATQTIAQALSGLALSIPIIGRSQEPNGEAIAYHSAGRGYFTVSEGLNPPIYFFAKTSGFIPEPPLSLITPGSGWKFRDLGSNEGTAWRERAFSDTLWPSGPAQLGYANGDEQTTISFGGNASSKYITTYFRKWFSVSDPSAIINLTLSTVFDDGIAVYINGTEVLRKNLAPAAGYLTRATVTGSPLENLWHTFLVTNSVLIAGTNLVAVEVHRFSPSENDLSFDLQLEASLRPAASEFVSPPQPLPSGAWILNVRGPVGAILHVEASSNLNSWTEVGTLVVPPDGTAAFTNSPPAPALRFFRLRH